MGRTHFTTVIALHDHLVTDDVDRLRARTLQKLHPSRQETVLQRCSCFWIFSGEDLLATDHQRDVCPERREHVDEFNSGDTRADDDNALRKHFRRVTVAGRENTCAVW